jgi:hypothetical protein
MGIAFLALFIPLFSGIGCAALRWKVHFHHHYFFMPFVSSVRDLIRAERSIRSFCHPPRHDVKCARFRKSFVFGGDSPVLSARCGGRKTHDLLSEGGQPSVKGIQQQTKESCDDGYQQ